MTTNIAAFAGPDIRAVDTDTMSKVVTVGTQKYRLIYNRSDMRRHKDRNACPECAIVRNMRTFMSRLPEMALSTNMLYDAALVPNIGLKLNVADHWNVGADWMTAWWSNREKRRYWRIYGGDFDVTYRLGSGCGRYNPFAGHHVGVYASMMYYDIQAGLSHQGIMSAKYNYAAGVSYTYSLPVHRHFNIDFFIGVGYMWGTYKKHTPIDDHDVWLSTRRRSWFGPTRAGISLVWVLGNKNYKCREGGRH